MSDDDRALDAPADEQAARRRKITVEYVGSHQQAELDAKFAKLRLVAGDMSKAPTEKFAHLLEGKNKIQPLLDSGTFDAIQQTMAEHQKRMAPIVAMLDNGVLADMERITAAIAPALAQAKAASDAVFTPQMRLMFEQLNRSHSSLFAKLDLAFPENPVVTGAIVGTQAAEYDTAMPGTVPTITTVPARSRPKITRQQQLTLLVTLVSLHGYVMDLRKADLADAGTLALIVALLLVVLALQAEEAE